MAARWMQQDMLKLKRDGMADSRGAFKRFSDKESKHEPRVHRAPGWYVAGTDKRSMVGGWRAAPRAMGPFATREAASKFARGMFDDASVKLFEVVAQ